MRLFVFATILFFAFNLHGQSIELDTMTKLPYHQIPDAPAVFTATTAAARMVDGLGYRYYWATKDLRKADLEYTPGNNGRKAIEVLDHLLGLSQTILNATLNKPNARVDRSALTWEEKRGLTLENFKQASDNLRNANVGAMEGMAMIFERGEQRTEFPFWNVINGPIADAISHVGQIVSYRRSAGNPIDPNVNVLRGKTREN